MEKQIEDYQTRINILLKCETDVIKYKHDLNEMQKQNDIDKLRIRELIEVRTKHELEIKSLLTDNSNINEELEYHKNKNRTGLSLLNSHNQDLDSAQAHHQQTARYLQFELDIKKLDNEIEFLKQNEVKLLNELKGKTLDTEQLVYKYENKVKKLTAQLEAKEMSLSENLERLKCLTHEVNELNQYKNYSNSLESELNMMKTEIRMLNEKKLNMNQLKFDHEQVMNKLITKLDAKEMSLSENIQKVKNLDAQLKDMIKYKANANDLELLVKDLKAELDAKEMSLTENIQKVKYLDAELKQMLEYKTIANELESEFKDLKTKCFELEKSTRVQVN
jgi:hypothetical protein